MRIFFRAVTLAAIAGPLCAAAAPALKGIYRAAELGLLEVTSTNGRVVGKFRTGGRCAYSVDDEVLTGTFEGNVFIGTVSLCQSGEGCTDSTKLYPLMAFSNSRELSGQVPLPDKCTSPGLIEGTRFTLEKATPEEEALALQPARALTDKIPRGKKEREVFAAKEIAGATEHFNKGRFGLAAQGFELAIAAGGENWGPLMMLGVCNVKLRKWKDGKSQIEKGLKLGGKSVPAELKALSGYALAVVAEAGGQRADAFNMLRSAVAQSAAPGAMVNELKFDPDLKKLRSDPGYPKLLDDLERVVARNQKKPRGG